MGFRGWLCSIEIRTHIAHIHVGRVKTRICCDWNILFTFRHVCAATFRFHGTTKELDDAAQKGIEYIPTALGSFCTNIRLSDH